MTIIPLICKLFLFFMLQVRGDTLAYAPTQTYCTHHPKLLSGLKEISEGEGAFQDNGEVIQNTTATDRGSVSPLYLHPGYKGI